MAQSVTRSVKQVPYNGIAGSKESTPVISVDLAKLPFAVCKSGTMMNKAVINTHVQVFFCVIESTIVHESTCVPHSCQRNMDPWESH